MKKKGAALLVVIIIMMLTFLMATIMIETSIKHLKVSNGTVENTKAYYCAETGVYDAINYIQLLASTGSFNSSCLGKNIPISNLYSKNENTGSNLYLFGDASAYYIASIELISPIEHDVEDVTINSIVVSVSTPLTKKMYNCKINSKGTYNNQGYLINDTVKIYYNSDSCKWNYSFNSKLSTKD